MVARPRKRGCIMRGVLYQINHAQIRCRVLRRRSEIAKLPGGLIMLNLIINRQYDISDMLDVERRLDESEVRR